MDKITRLYNLSLELKFIMSGIMQKAELYGK